MTKCCDDKFYLGCTAITITKVNRTLERRWHSGDNSPFSYHVRMTNKGRVKDTEKEFEVTTHFSRETMCNLLEFLNKQYNTDKFCSECGQPIID